MKKLWDRKSLISFFRKGQAPSEVHFEYLIESTINKLDDGFTKSIENGLQLAPVGASENVLSILKDPADQHPSWQMSLKNEESSLGLSFDTINLGQDKSVQKTSRLFLAENGKIGIGTIKPITQLDVAGTLGTNSRIGTYKIDQVPGDGEWHSILEGLKGLEAFEIVARIAGEPQKGKYAVTHAIALSTYGRSSQSIKQVRAYMGWFMNRIEFRWLLSGDKKKFALQVRTRWSYGRTPAPESADYMIQFHITRLWDDSVFQQIK